MPTDNAQRRATLDSRIKQFHDVSFEQVLSEIAYLRDAGDSVIAGGSLAYGLGNHLSDLDLVVGGPTTVDSTGIPLEHFIGSLRVDVWKLAQGLIEKTFGRAEEALMGDAPLLGSFGDVDHEDELKLMHRIVFGIVVDGPGLEFSRDQRYQAVASSLVVREYGERMRTSALVAQLALQAERPLAAVISSRLAVEEALNATVIDRGLPFTGDKWLSERLASDATDLAAVYEPFRQLPDEPVGEAPTFVDAALTACSRSWRLDLSLEALLAAASWRNTDLQLFGVGDEKLLVSAQSGALWDLTESEAEAWGALAGAGAEEPGATWDLQAGGVDAMTLCLRLHEEGVLDLHWPEGVKLEDLKGARSVQV